MSNQSLREAAQQALEALKIYVSTYNDYWERGMEILEPIGEDAISRLEAALAQPEVKALPVAWLHESGVLRLDKDMEPIRKELDSWTPLYTTPKSLAVQQATWAPDANSGMRYPEESDLTGGETDCSQQPPAEQPEPEWIDDPHDIEQGMMRNPKWKAADRARQPKGAELSDEQKKALIRAAGGIVHSDGNIFFTNFAQFLTAADRAARGGSHGL